MTIAALTRTGINADLGAAAVARITPREGKTVNVFMLDDEKLKTIMHALTLRDRGEDKREQWMNKGFKSMHSRPGSLFKYWKRRVAEDPDAMALAAQVYREYLEHMQNPGSKEGQSPPSMMRRARNLAGSVVAETAAIAKGQKPVSAEEKARRLAICEGCEFFNKPRRMCLKCGCFMDVKAGWRSARCPIGKWAIKTPTAK